MLICQQYRYHAALNRFADMLGDMYFAALIA